MPLLDKACCFINSWEVPKNKKILIISSVETLIKDMVASGCNRFISPFCSNADMLCAKVVSRMKLTYPNIILEAWIPSRNFLKENDDDFMLMMQECDIINIEHERFDKRLYNKSFRDMIDVSYALISVFDGNIDTETYRNLKYAYENNKKIKVIEI